MNLETLKLRYIHGEHSEWKDYTIFNKLLEDLYGVDICAFPLNRNFKTENS